MRQSPIKACWGQPAPAVAVHACPTAMADPEKPQAGKAGATVGGNIEMVATVGPDGTVPIGTMSSRRLRSEDYNDYSSTDVTPEGSPSNGPNSCAGSSTYQRFGETNGTT